MTMANITLSPERRAQILRGVRPRRGKALCWTTGRILVAAVLAVLLTFSAFAAAVPALRTALQNALGSFAGQSQSLTGIAMEYDGIEVRPVSALSSSTYVRIWAEVQDKTGDRLRADMDIDGYVADVPTLGISQFSLPQVISYDEETHTALIEFSSTGYGVTENVPVSICFDRFQPRQKISDVSVPIELVTAQTLASTTAPDGSVVLVPEQTPVALEHTDSVRLSSFGFANDGRLHLQLAFLNAANREDSYLITTARSISGGKDDAVYNQELGNSMFEENGIWYQDMSFSVSPSDLGDVTFDDLAGTLLVLPAVTGEWSTDITIRPVEEITYYPNVQVGGALVKEIRVSEIGFYALSSSQGTILGYRPTFAMTKDGKKLYLTNNCIESGWCIDDWNGSSGAGHAIDQWLFDEPIDPASIASLNFDGVTVPLQ
ncbi:hypothetical protein [Agathobaculum massiliense]|uniref:hypothetical protein n=2 Tax=Butyricicoccaceae TaxID=3085642 RepID=UPI000D1FA4CD|nr:hypothetical protein [Agathobaculum massiliense]